MKISLTGHYWYSIFNSFEEQLDLSTLLVLIDKRHGDGISDIGKYDDILIVFFVNQVNSTQNNRIICFGFRQGQVDLLIALRFCFGIYFTGTSTIIIQVFTGHILKLSSLALDVIQVGKINVTHMVNNQHLMSLKIIRITLVL